MHIHRRDGVGEITTAFGVSLHELNRTRCSDALWGDEAVRNMHVHMRASTADSTED